MTTKKVRWTRKDLIGLEELSKEELELILDTAESFREISERQIKKVPALRGKTVVNLFYEPSTRTRMSFELAAKRLSADILNISANTSSIVKGETLIDTARNIEAMKVNVIIMRHPAAGSPALLAKSVAVSVINAGDGSHEHPTQGLLDIFTIKRRKGRIEGLNISIIGDITHSRVARSNIWALTKLGARVTVCGPPTLIPPFIERLGVRVVYDLEEALKEADVINLLRIQHERQKKNLFPSVREYALRFGINADILKKAKLDILIMHPGPINRGIELSQEAADCKNSVILEQVTNGVAIRMAVLYLVTQGGQISDKEQVTRNKVDK